MSEIIRCNCCGDDCKGGQSVIELNATETWTLCSRCRGIYDGLLATAPRDILNSMVVRMDFETIPPTWKP